MFAGVGPLGQAGAVQHIIDLATDQRDVPGTIDIGIQREQADITIGPLYSAVLRQPFDRYHIHVMGVVDRRTGIGLGHHHQTTMGNVLGHLVVGGNKLFRVGITAAGAGQAKPGIMIQGKLDAVVHGLRPGAGIAQEGKMIQ